MKADFEHQEKEIRMADLRLFKALWPNIKPYWWMLLLSTILVFLVTFFELMQPIFIQKALDGFIVPQGSKTGIDLFGTPVHSFKLFCTIFLQQNFAANLLKR